MAYSTPLIARIYNHTSRSFGLTIQGDNVWMYPNGETELHYDPLSACFPKEEINIISLVKKGVISIEIKMFDGYKYNSVGYYVVDTKTSAKPVVKAPAVVSTKEVEKDLVSVATQVESAPATPEAKAFTFEPVVEKEEEGVDPFNPPEKTPYFTPKAEEVKEAKVEETTEVKEDNVITKMNKRSKKNK